MEGFMKAIVKTQKGVGAEFQMVKIPQIKPGEVLVKVLAASICGSDVHIYDWDPWAQPRVKPPCTIGHEFSGIVVEAGSAVTTIKVGDNISSETHFVCGTCDFCKTGNGHICENTVILGINTNGAFAEYVAIPESAAWKNPTNVDPALLAIQEPLGNAVHTILSGDIVGKTVAVVGCGPIGALGVTVAKACSPAKLIVLEPSEYRAAMAKQLGADVVINPIKEDAYQRVMEETEGRGVEVVAEMSGNIGATEAAFKYLRSGGRISLLGLSSKKISLDLDYDVIAKGITIHGITGRLIFNTWHQVRGLINSGKVDLDTVVTHRFSLEKYADAIDIMKSGRSGKVVLCPDVPAYQAYLKQLGKEQEVCI